MTYDDAAEMCTKRNGHLATWSNSQSVHSGLLKHAENLEFTGNAWIGAFYSEQDGNMLDLICL